MGLTPLTGRIEADSRVRRRPNTECRASALWARPEAVPDDQLRYVRDTQDRETAVAVEEPDAQHATDDVAAWGATTIRQVRRILQMR